MFKLTTLGAIDLCDDSGKRVESILLRAKRLSLLVYLSTSHPPQLHRRDTLVALLWPELDDAHARGALRHELSQLRRALGRETLRGAGAEALGVDTWRIWCDARAFEAALDAGCVADALALWRGEFLPGLHVPGGEFGRWLDGTRDRLARRAVDAADGLRTKAQERGDVTSAVRWARRCVELAPYDETLWCRLFALLDRIGDRAGALMAYRVFARRLRQDLELEPSPETRALVEHILRRGTAAASIADECASQAAVDTHESGAPRYATWVESGPRVSVQ